jgi:hypothetical protein
MHHAEVDRVLAAAPADRRLLDHPFYRRWEAGKVSIAELGAYAAQYRTSSVTCRPSCHGSPPPCPKDPPAIW